jgi:aryl-alcohol dehydrogenase-like predicted oxidoreductase
MDTFDIGGDLTVGRLGFCAMCITGEDTDGEPAAPEAARDVLRRAADTVDLVDTGCGPRPAKLFVTTVGM